MPPHWAKSAKLEKKIQGCLTLPHTLYHLCSCCDMVSAQVWYVEHVRADCCKRPFCAFWGTYSDTPLEPYKHV